MKQLLSVMAVILCAWFSMGFTTPSNKNSSATGTNPHSQILRWKNTTWVNPWVNTKRLYADNFLTLTAVASNRVPIKAHLSYAGTSLYIGDEGHMWYDIPAGNLVTCEVEVNPDPNVVMFIAIQDETSGEYLYETFGTTAFFQWTPIAGHQYFVHLLY
jgi:hypothetical protein